jgi:hypothetical protein
MRATLLAFTASLAAGALAAWGLHREAAPPAPAEASASPAPRAKPARKLSKDDLNQLVADANQGQPDDPGLVNPLTPRLADWSTAEIRSALEEFLVSPDCAIESEDGIYIAGLLAGEWMRRDMDAALRWFESIPSETVRGDLSVYVSQYWPQERAAEALAYVVAHPDLFSGFGGASSYRIVLRSLSSAATRGVKEFTECLALAQANGLPVHTEGVPLPEDFDFAALAESDEIRKLATEKGKYFFAEAWLKKDREAAFAAIAALAEENKTNPARSLVALDQGPVPAEELKARIDLYTGWLQDREPAERDGMLESTVRQFSIRPAAIHALAESLQDPAQREQVHLHALAGVRDLGVAEAMKHLDTFREPADRLDLLESFEAKPLAYFPRGKMNAKQEENFRKTLESWGADAQRSDRIVARIQEIMK